MNKKQNNSKAFPKPPKSKSGSDVRTDFNIRNKPITESGKGTGSTGPGIRSEKNK